MSNLNKHSIVSIKIFSLMKKVSLYYCLVLLLCFSHIVKASSLVASVDRKDISLDDLVYLQIRFDGNIGFSSPSWKSLNKDFEVISQNRSTNIKAVNGQMESVTEWSLTLAPKREGKLTIPSFSYKGENSKPITITVTKSSPSQSLQGDSEFRFDVTISSGPYYVQQQILYVERLYYTVDHENPNLSEFEITDARVELLNEPKAKFDIIDGKRQLYYERQYAIFPEESGELVIPGQRFTADIRNRRDRFGRGRMARVMSEPKRLTINSIPANYPSAPWIPAKKLTITETNATRKNTWKVGEPVTRSFVMDVIGLTANQVPPIPLPEIDGFKYYPEQSEETSDVIAQGVKATILQSVAIIPTKAGKFSLPEINIPWWNTDTQSIEYATIASRQVTIIGDVSLNGNDTQSRSSNTDTDNTTQKVEPSVPSNTNDTRNENTFLAPPVERIFYALLALSVLLNIILLSLWLRAQSHSKSQVTHHNNDSNKALAETKSSEELLHNLKKACESNDAFAIRVALLNWAKIAFNNTEIVSVDTLTQHIISPRLKSAIYELEEHLYSKAPNDAFNGMNIWQLLDQSATSRRIEQPKTDYFESLYPNQ